MKYNIITIGGATEDITFYTREGILIDNKKDILRQKLLGFEYGAKIKVDRAYVSFGGGAANTAVCFSRLGFRVAALLSVGADERGQRIINNLKKQRVSVNLVQRSRQTESGFSFLLVGPNNEHIVFSNRAANRELKVTKREKRVLKMTDWIYITSLSGNWDEVLKSVFSSPTARIAWNPGHIQLKAGIKQLDKYLGKTAVLLVNKDEAIELVVSLPEFRSKNYRYLNNVKNLLRVLKGQGPEMVVITSGKYGADVYDGKNFYHQGILKEKKRVDTTGVGDAFGSSFIAGLELYRGDIRKAMRLAIKNTASVISRQGAQNGLLRKSGI